MVTRISPLRKFLVLIFLLCLFQVSGFAQLKGKVVSIADGDTFTILTDKKQQIKIRLYGIDCPEKSQDYGTVAKNFTSDMIFGKSIEAVQKDIDRYGRTIAIVMVEGQNLNEALLKSGLAWHYSFYDHNKTWQQMQTTAQKNKIGLWASQTTPIAPWDFRRNRK